MRKQSDEQKKIVDDILYKKKPIKTFTFLFTTRCKDKKNIHINVQYTKYATTLHKNNDRC